jgi:hypothetical protein
MRVERVLLCGMKVLDIDSKMIRSQKWLIKKS